MKLIILSKVDIKSKKDGREWVKIWGLSPKAQLIDSFMSKEQFEAMGLSSDFVLSQEDVNELFKTYQSVDVSFDFQGRLESISESSKDE